MAKTFPVTPEQAALGRERALEVRQERALARMQRSEVVHRIVSETEDLAPASLSAALAFVAKLEEALPGLEIDDMLSAQRAANTAEIIHRISRLASGQSTANVAHASMSEEERKERMAYLRSRIGQLEDAAPDAPRDATQQ